MNEPVPVYSSPHPIRSLFRQRAGFRNARTLALFAVFCAVYGLAAAAVGQMLNPSMDAPDQPFSYYSQPTDVIGVMDAPTATLVSPEGFLYTGYGELMFFTGNPPAPIHQRIKTLVDGYLPIVQYGWTREGLRYDFTAFAATLNGRPSGTLVDFVRVTVRNESPHSQMAWIATAMRYEGQDNTGLGIADNRYSRPATPKRLGEYTQLGATFSPDWKYSADHGTIQRDHKILYFYPTNPTPIVRYTIKHDNAVDGMLDPRAFPVRPTTPMGFVQYSIPLQAGQTITLNWKLPVVPLSADSPQAAQVRAADFDRYLSQTTDFWQTILHRGIDIEVPEEKVNDTFKASLIYDLIARDKIGNDYVQTVNKFNYHAFWLRDISNVTRMYDVSGYPDYAAQVLAFFPRWQQPDGNYVSQGGQFDGIGQALWIYGEHYKITHDQNFANSVFPSVVRAVAWIHQARQNDPLHLLPVTRPGDDERLEGHVTGHNFWALDGLNGAIAIAEGTGHTQQAAQFHKEYQDYRATFIRVLQSVTATTGGAIPPGLDGRPGQDWGNMLAVYPGIVLEPDDPMVTATLNATRAKYQEGIMTYDDGRFLHHYLTLKNTETEIIRGDQQLAVEELYAVLLHTSSTHAGFEYKIPPWGDRDFGEDLSPHGWFAADYRTTLRNMLVREQGNDLHLLSVVSPEWIQPGKRIVLQHAPTNFGSIGLTLRCQSASQAEIALQSSFVNPPKQIVLHLPWFMKTTRVVADGASLPIQANRVLVPASAHTINITWTRQPDAPNLSYDNAVKDYKTEYARRYQMYRTGKQ